MKILILLFLIFSILCMYITITYRKKILTRENIPYLIRYSIFDCKYFSIKIHKILQSDIGGFHDHPWDYISIMIKGSYIEETVVELDTPYIITRQIKIKSPSIIYRNGKKLHRLLLEENKTCTTIVITSKKYRSWNILPNNEGELIDNKKNKR